MQTLRAIAAALLLASCSSPAPRFDAAAPFDAAIDAPIIDSGTIDGHTPDAPFCSPAETLCNCCVSDFPIECCSATQHCCPISFEWEGCAPIDEPCGHYCPMLPSRCARPTRRSW